MGWPHFRGVGKLENSSAVVLFIGGWTEIAQPRMTSLAVVKDFDVLEDRLLGLLARLIGMPIGSLTFEGADEAFH